MFYYKDLNETNPTQNPNLFDVDSIVQNLVNLILTRKGTKIFDPNFGIDLDDYLFELINEDSAAQIFNVIVDAIRIYEPRVILNFSQSDVIADEENNSYSVELFFEIEGFDNDGKLYNITETITG